MSPDTLLHWLCDGVTYSVKRLNARMGMLIVTGPGTLVRRGRRDIPLPVVFAWEAMSIKERCDAAAREIDPA